MKLPFCGLARFLACLRLQSVGQLDAFWREGISLSASLCVPFLWSFFLAVSVDMILYFDPNRRIAVHRMLSKNDSQGRMQSKENHRYLFLTFWKRKKTQDEIVVSFLVFTPRLLTAVKMFSAALGPNDAKNSCRWGWKSWGCVTDFDSWRAD